ncbi:ribulose-phosphate 3-epimerase [Lactobacillus amylolyticus DSM 11664]|uniref:Ribulose-phosphate 3-epimerase n=2 Tax=Lactobacillus amylolyticus TaxID=83683 RepID=D4YS83_9LACO|nr:ribulose-phosphate 3-epimerase [Lactobacillus amylolyticus DSM 11664]
MGDKMLIAPSILNANNLTLKDEIKRATNAGITRFHIDIMDGHFVPNLSFGPQLVSDFKTEFPITEAEIHLMSNNPKVLIPAFVKAGADLLEFHYEAMQPNEVKYWLDYLKSNGVKAGLVLNPDTPIPVVEQFKNQIDQLLLMTVHPGFGGQKFLENSASRIKEARELVGKDIAIEVDGGINQQTARIAKDAGANVFVAGSYLFEKGDIASQIAKLTQSLS